MTVARHASSSSFSVPRWSVEAQSLTGLVGGLSAKYQSWRGLSGRRYVCTVFDAHDLHGLDVLQSYSDAVVLVVRRAGDGVRELIGVADVGAQPELFWTGSALAALQSEGIDEFHVYLTAETAGERQAMIADLLGPPLH